LCQGAHWKSEKIKVALPEANSRLRLAEDTVTPQAIASNPAEGYPNCNLSQPVTQRSTGGDAAGMGEA